MLRRSTAASRASPLADVLAGPPARTTARPRAFTSSAARERRTPASTPASFATASGEKGARARAASAFPASGPLFWPITTSWATAAATDASWESRTRIRLSALAPVSVRRPSTWTKRLMLFAAPPAGPGAPGARRWAKSRSRPSAGSSRNSVPKPTIRSALSSLGRGTRESPNALFQALDTASTSSGDHSTCARPVCPVRSAIAARSDGLSTGPVRRTAGPFPFPSRGATAALITGQELATGPPLPRRTETGPGARSGSYRSISAAWWRRVSPRPLASFGLGATRMGRPSRVLTSAGEPSSTVA